MSYVDGFVMPLPKKSLAKYKKLAALASKVLIDHGALHYMECIGDDLKVPIGVPYPKLLKLKPTETAVFAFILYSSRAHRDKVNVKVMQDPRLKYDPNNMPFDFSKMTFGGFSALVESKTKKSSGVKLRSETFDETNESHMMDLHKLIFGMPRAGKSPRSIISELMIELSKACSDKIDRAYFANQSKLDNAAIFKHFTENLYCVDETSSLKNAQEEIILLLGIGDAPDSATISLCKVRRRISPKLFSSASDIEANYGLPVFDKRVNVGGLCRREANLLWPYLDFSDYTQYCNRRERIYWYCLNFVILLIQSDKRPWNISRNMHSYIGFEEGEWNIFVGSLNM